MIVNKIQPQGYCNGVKRALEIVDKALKDKTIPRPIYLLGHIIHNKIVVNQLKEKGAIIIEDKTKTRLELLDQINCGSVIFSAHGVSPEVVKKAKDKGLYIIDATCGYVNIVHNRIISYLNNGFDCIYVGTKNHPECEGVLGISKKIHFILTLDDINKLNITNDKIYMTNQTTLSMFDLEDIIKLLKEKYPNIIIDNKICNATTIRQQAMAIQDKVDLCIVVGDSASSNTKKLALVSEKKANIKTILCEDINSLDKTILKKINSVSVSSGASTPDYVVDEIIDYLKSI